MPLLSQPSSAARTARLYITVGALLVVWTGIWYVYLRNEVPDAGGVYYWCAGLLVTGLTLFSIGLALGRIGRAARHAELPPPEVTQTLASAEQAAAARAPLVASVNPAAPAAPGVGAAAGSGGVPVGHR
jgi:hypothetical protein